MKKTGQSLGEYMNMIETTDDELSVVIKGHYGLENLIEKILVISVPSSGALDFKRITFMLKVDLLISLGLLDSKFKPMLNFINSIRNKFAHNPYSLFDEKDALKIRTILMQQKVFNHLLRNSTLPKDVLDDSLCCAFALIEAILKNKYIKIHAAKLVNERVIKVLGAIEKPEQRARRKAFYKQVEDELKDIYPELYD
ncbi:hypothetical protein R4R77_002617 [Citrobacter amalonaticus]|nr:MULTISPECIES: hypothetical protein [Citrobacter]MDU1755510.1 hypothetical protein [Citrobacter sp.]ELR9582957.1 hypothetical protein [Citrobacter amalonaticus]MDV2138909.1 hypothetical protein [Citrobacter amalonaticus]MEB0586416.1 hypothetical protein [Citrobacter amalonaticus]QIO41063.1 hypothetical protein HAP28_19620 [Citrobacter sp. Y3]